MNRIKQSVAHQMFVYEYMYFYIIMYFFALRRAVVNIFSVKSVPSDDE